MKTYSTDDRLTETQIEVINGSLLGDAWLPLRRSNEANSLFAKTQSKRDHKKIDKISYMNYLVDLFNTFDPIIYEGSIKSGPLIRKNRTWKEFYDVYRFQTSRHPIFKELEKKWYIEEDRGFLKRRKIVPLDLKLTPLALCHWYMDDGCNNPKDANIEISTQGFTIDEVDFLIEILKRDLNIIAKKKYLIKDKINAKQVKIYVGRKSYFNFIDMIKPHIQWYCFQYKIDTSAYNKLPHCGENHSRTKLKDSQLEEVFRLRDQGMIHREIGLQLGVKECVIGDILRGTTRKNHNFKTGLVVKPPTLLSKEEREEVIKLKLEGMPIKLLAEKFNVNQSTIVRIMQKFKLNKQ